MVSTGKSSFWQNFYTPHLGRLDLKSSELTIPNGLIGRLLVLGAKLLGSQVSHGCRQGHALLFVMDVMDLGKCAGDYVK